MTFPAIEEDNSRKSRILVECVEKFTKILFLEK